MYLIFLLFILYYCIFSVSDFNFNFIKISSKDLYSSERNFWVTYLISGFTKNLNFSLKLNCF